MLDELALLKREVERLRAEADIQQLQHRYGYYDEYYQWDRIGRRPFMRR